MPVASSVHFSEWEVCTIFVDCTLYDTFLPQFIKSSPLGDTGIGITRLAGFQYPAEVMSVTQCDIAETASLDALFCDGIVDIGSCRDFSMHHEDLYLSFMYRCPSLQLIFFLVEIRESLSANETVKFGDMYFFVFSEYMGIYRESMVGIWTFWCVWIMIARWDEYSPVESFHFLMQELQCYLGYSFWVEEISCQKQKICRNLNRMVYDSWKCLKEFFTSLLSEFHMMKGQWWIQMEISALDNFYRFQCLPSSELKFFFLNCIILPPVRTVKTRQTPVFHWFGLV